MDALDLARWQFGITTVYHFFFVPITIGLSLLVAVMQTRWMRTRDPQWLRLTKFFGKLFTINFALGLVTGIVQEFQFGMNWSDYSRFVGDIFGAPLAIEALLAFFLESTFLGLWLFGWGRIPEKLHLSFIWLVHVGTVLSAYFILAANSFMQNPVGYTINEANGRAELTDFLAVLTNPVQLVTFPHVVAAAYMTGGAFVLAFAIWHLSRTGTPAVDKPIYRKAAKLGAWTVLVASLVVIGSGDVQGKVMTEVQPMKMAAAEGLYEDVPEGVGAPFSIITVGTLDGREEVWALTVPKLLSYLATGSLEGAVEGIDHVQERYELTYSGDELTAAEDYRPVVPVTYWSFRLMMGLGFAGMAIAAAVLWALRGTGSQTGESRLEGHRMWAWAGALVLFMPLLANSFGWIFTEMGRQPWLVMGLMTTQTGVSPGTTTGEVLTSMVVFTLLYGALAVVEVGLTLRYGRAGAEQVPEDPSFDPAHRSDDDAFVFTY
ncbi:cytochrome ubiquinol oxidase subunit I [Ornithinimicrobium cerasi]|uniref:Cytochrome bd-I ubiquinol oxidase subunit 1 apoprotein n=1 Tax=Ornithinimicrobium cerasi TaxID=2248773 RepID=A0A285VTL7_9MICO|nr:cytochrome ubiquinol oxidase subunit I [Ornithinimicrobium cerasi]SOC57392.1 cytochrome bd-I ubiquinol oxidase subunit 1 apoprotein [Ornithinimicrobium cerasi]